MCPGVKTANDGSDNYNVKERLLRGEQGVMGVLAGTKVKDIRRDA
jgi:hypothetical protein